jgi:uncharacterized protein
MRSAHLKIVCGIILFVLMAGTSQPAGSQNRETGYAVKKPVFGGGNAVQPWGILGYWVKAAMKDSGWDIQLCTVCQGGAREARLLTSKAMPVQPAAGSKDPRQPNGPIDFGATGAQFLKWVYHGTHDFAKEPGKPQNQVRVIANLQDPSYMLVAVKESLGITDLRQLKNKKDAPLKILASPQGGDTVQAILDYYGLSKEFVESTGGKFLAWNRPEERKDVDVMIGFGALVKEEYDHWIDVTEHQNMRFLDLPADLKKKLVEGYDLQEVAIPEGLLRGFDHAMQGIGRTGDAIYGRDDMPDDFAYALAKALDEHKDLLQWTLVPFSYNSQNVWRCFDVPLHPGAARYYKEKGYMR